MSVNPKMGSAGGTIIHLNIQGVGPNTLNLDVLDSSGKSICQSVSIPKYGEVRCHTLSEEIENTKL